jgi:hypothetical protein
MLAANHKPLATSQFNEVTMLTMLLIWLCLAAAGALIMGTFMAMGRGPGPEEATEGDLEACARSVHPTWWAHRPRPLIGATGTPLERRRRERRDGERRGERM